MIGGAEMMGEDGMRRLIAQADKNGWDSVRVSSETPVTVEAGVWALLEGRRFVARTSKKNAVQVQISFHEPWKPTEDKAVSGFAAGADAERVRALFGRWFRNPLQVIRLEQAGTFGQPVEIAARVDLTGMDSQSLVLYSFDAKTNSYKPIENPNSRIDKNGYLRFTTALAGDIIVSSGRLAKK